MTGESNSNSVVKKGGIAREPSDAEDVTRDTYGSPQPTGVRENEDERVAEADGAAAAVGIPGVDATEEERGSEAGGARAQDEELRRTDLRGDRVASSQDAEKLKNRDL
jgi:hypothetical protein